jgi:hypothetical protein
VSNELTNEEKKLLEGVAMPGDADEAGQKLQAEREVFEKQAKRGVRGKEAKQATEGKTGDDGDKAVKADTAAKQAGTEKSTIDGARGPLSPEQHDDDGWGDTPVQMRGGVE